MGISDLYAHYKSQFDTYTELTPDDDMYDVELARYLIESTPWYEHLRKYLEAKHKAEFDAFTLVHKSKIMNGDTDNRLLLSELSQHIGPKDRSSRYFFITVNAKPQVSFERFKSVIQTCANLKVIKFAIYVFEQRSEVIGEYSGFHAHMLICRAKPRSAMEQSLKRSLLSVCDVDNKSILNIKEIPIDAVEQKIDYMKGNKVDEKKAKSANDVYFRQEYGLEAYYTTLSCPPLLVGDT